VSLGGLDTCACKRGFFTLRDCTNPATTSCSICTRRVCDEHLAPRIDSRVCVECAAKQEEGTLGTTGPQAGQPGAPGVPGQQQAPGAPGEPQMPAHGPQLERLDPTSAAVRYRSRYYRSYNYEPMWWGSYDPYWNDYDYRWYGDDDDDDDGGGFSDS
jgi:hypothetical protein